MTAFLRGAGIVVAVVVLLYAIVLKFGTVETELECSGQVLRNNDRSAQVIPATPATLYAKFDTFRWFIFWVDHDGRITWEIQPGGDGGFGYYTKSNFASPISDLYRTKHYGSFSSLSNHISVQTSEGRDTFVGMCK